MSNVLIPTNYSQDIDDFVLEVNYLKSDASVNASLLSWTVQDFTNSSFTIKLNFDNPLEVSVSSVRPFNLNFPDIGYSADKILRQLLFYDCPRYLYLIYAIHL